MSHTSTCGVTASDATGYQGYFDEIIDRTGTISVKQGMRKEFGIDDDVLAMWVADMDLRAPREVCEGVIEAGKLGIFGYSAPKEAYFDALKAWNERRHGFRVEKEWVVRSPGVVSALAFAVQAFTKEGDGILIMQPVYFPFQAVIEKNNRRVVKNRLLTGEDGRFAIDFEDFEKKIVEEDVKMFVLCSPHNPGGRVWTREELSRLAGICLAHRVLMISDEIHYDFVFPGHTHTVLAALSEEVADHCIVCTAPSKTFNVAGLELSNIIIPNQELREAFSLQMSKASVGAGNIIGLEACRLSYEYGEPWLEELLGYLQENVAIMRRALSKTDKIRMMEPDGTYLLWLDCRGLGLFGEDLKNFFLKEARLWLNDGYTFGEGGEGFMRMNLGCPRSVALEAADRLLKALENR